MKRYKYSAIMLAALVCGAAWASVNALTGGKKGNGEKVRPSESLMAQARTAPNVRYAKMKLEGSADGVPYGLKLMDVSDKTVKLSWVSPEATDGYFDDFENHQDFAINSAGNIGWSYIDGDNANTYTWQACTFPTQGSKMAFVVMNPWMTTPAVNENPNYQPYSGQKMLVDFCAVDVQNNDYIISPELNFNQDFQVSFQARSYKVGDNFNPERIRVGYSTTGKRPSDFKYVNDGPYVELPAAWTLVKYTIPKEAKYVTINCVSDDAFMLMIDDIFVGTNKVRPAINKRQAAAADPVVGFNVYRNGQQLNTTPVDSVRYTDQVPNYGDYTYTVAAVHQSGAVSAQSEPISVNVPDVRLLPFEDDFDDWTLHEDKWSTVNLDNNEECNWSIDYDEYGLVDAAATYKWSAQTNYDQALVTRELHTTDRSNTWLRFNLKLRNSQQTYVDYLDVEVSSDGGKTWEAVDAFDNYSGKFDWTTYQYNLGEDGLLTSDLFKVRFRAHGENAKWINYWYVDDVKIWNPVWAKGQLTVQTADGPLAKCEVTLTGDNGAVINSTTDKNGNISFDQIEEGKYTVSIVKDGYNEYSQIWTVKKGSDNKFTATLSSPKVSLSSQEVSADMEAESNLTKNFTLKNDGDGPLTWYLRENVAAGKGDISHRWETMPSFTTSGDLQQSIAFDGEYYYTTSSIELGKFWKYDKNGKFIEQFSIPKMYYKLYDITYDGRYFYGSDWNSRLFVLDFDNRRVVDIINISGVSDLKITHCTYDPNYDGFWIGTFTTIGLINRKGKFIRKMANLTSDNSVAIYGSAYDNVSPGGPYLWLSDMTTESSDKLDKIQIRQYDISKGVLTDVKHVLTDAPGYKLGDSSTGANYVCGLFSSMDIVPGKLTLVGTLNQSPNLVFRYTLAETNKWLNIAPKHGVLAPGAEQVFNVGLDALEAKKGDNFETTATLFTNPEMPNQEISFKLNATSESSVPRPQEVKAEAGSASVALTWNKGNGSAVADGYNVYRNHVKVNAQPIKDMKFTDAQLTYGSYAYQVTALYGGKESAKSDSVVAFVKDGAQYYAPLHLASDIKNNKNVHLSWDSPLVNIGHRDTLSWANGKHADEVGLASGGYFYAAAKWDANDYVPYRNKKVSSVSIQLVNTVTYLASRIYKDGQLICTTRYRGNINYDGSFTDIPLSKDVYLEPGHEYMFAFQIMNDADVNPLGIDDGKTVNGKGNLLSMDGKTWFTAAETGISGNFNIRVNVAPNSEQKEETPAGYNIYRDGVKVNNELVAAQSYDDVVSGAGTYNYAVSSVYQDGGESAKSENTSVEAFTIDHQTAPHHLNATVKRNRDVSLRWDNPTEKEQCIPADVAKRPVTTDANCPEFVREFDGAMSSMGVVTDGNNIYTSVYNEDGVIEKYTLDGKKVQSYQIDGIEGIRNLACDGQYLYAADYTNNIHQIDLKTMRKTKTIAISEYSRHLAYIPTLNDGNGGFETGDWTTSIYMAKDGSKLGTGPTLKGAAGTAYYDGKLYAFEQGNSENAYTIGIYDMATSERVGSLDMGKYLEIEGMSNYKAGGMSSFVSPEGITYMLLALQRQGYPTKFVVLDMGGLKTVAGYNVYRNDEKLNAEPLTRRYFQETLSQEGNYDYRVETVYIDGTVSAKSDAATAAIVATGEAKVPESVKAVPSTYAYNVLLSFKDPDMYKNAEAVNSYESLADDTEVMNEETEAGKSNWKVSSSSAFDGYKSIVAAKKVEAFGIVKAEGMKYVRIAAKNADDHDGNGTLDIYYSTGGPQRDNFIRLNSYSTNEAWQDIFCELPENTEYIALAKAEGKPAQYVDGLSFYKETPVTDCYGFDIYRNGEKINAEPVEDISYVDHNLIPGKYEYQVRLITKNSAESDFCDAINLELNYDNGSLAPTNLRVEDNDGSRKLTWQTPALGEPIYLRWHDGNSYDAAGQSNGGAFFAGAKWFASDLKGYENLKLSDVEVYINQIPDALYVLVYQNNTLVRQQNVPVMKQYSFNTIHLDEPLQIDPTKDMLVAVYVEHNQYTAPLGYDAGPARSGRGDLYSSDGLTWSTMEDSGANIDANWNISIGLSPYSASGSLKSRKNKNEANVVKFTPKANVASTGLKVSHAAKVATSDKNSFLGYNVYCNGDKLNESMLSGNTYVDNSVINANYLEYQVAAVYSATGEQYSNKVTIMSTGIDGVKNSKCNVEVVGNNLRITGAHTGDNISVYSVDGKLVAHSVVEESYVQNVSLANLTIGTYIVKIGKETLKVRISRR